MAYTVKDTQQVFVGYQIPKDSNGKATTPTAVGDVNVLTDADNGVSIQFVNKQKELTRTSIIKPGQVTYMKAKKGTDLNSKLYITSVLIDPISINAGEVYTLHIIFPDYYPTSSASMRTFSFTHIAKASDTADTIAQSLSDQMNGFGIPDSASLEHKMAFKAEVPVGGVVIGKDSNNNDITKPGILIREVFNSSIFELGVTPVVNLIKHFEVTSDPIIDYTSVTPKFDTTWIKVNKHYDSVDADDYLYKLAEAEWLIHGYKSTVMRHLNDYDTYMINRSKLMLDYNALPIGASGSAISDLATLDIHFEEPGDGSILSQKNLLIIAPKAVVNDIGNEINTKHGTAFTALS